MGERNIRKIIKFIKNSLHLSTCQSLRQHLLWSCLTNIDCSLRNAWVWSKKRIGAQRNEQTILVKQQQRECCLRFWWLVNVIYYLFTFTIKRTEFTRLGWTIELFSEWSSAPRVSFVPFFATKERDYKKISN